jgi:hypothetical protein
MEKKLVALGKPVDISGVTIIPVTQIRIYSWPYNSGANFFCTKKPLYVLVSTAGATLKAFNMDGTETTLEAIREKHPELQTAFDSLAGE